MWRLIPPPTLIWTPEINISNTKPWFLVGIVGFLIFRRRNVFSHIIQPRAAKAGTLPCRKTVRGDEFDLKSLKPPIESRSQDLMYL